MYLLLPLNLFLTDAHLAAQELRRSLQLLDAVDAVFDGYPAVESCAAEDREYGVIVDNACSDLAMNKLCIVRDALRSYRYTRLWPAIRSMYRHHAMCHAPQQFIRIFVCKQRI